MLMKKNMYLVMSIGCFVITQLGAMDKLPPLERSVIIGNSTENVPSFKKRNKLKPLSSSSTSSLVNSMPELKAYDEDAQAVPTIFDGVQRTEVAMVCNAIEALLVRGVEDRLFSLPTEQLPDLLDGNIEKILINISKIYVNSSVSAQTSTHEKKREFIPLIFGLLCSEKTPKHFMVVEFILRLLIKNSWTISSNSEKKQYEIRKFSQVYLSLFSEKLIQNNDSDLRLKLVTVLQEWCFIVQHEQHNNAAYLFNSAHTALRQAFKSVTQVLQLCGSCSSETEYLASLLEGGY